MWCGFENRLLVPGEGSSGAHVADSLHTLTLHPRITSFYDSTHVYDFMSTRRAQGEFNDHISFGSGTVTLHDLSTTLLGVFISDTTHFS